MSPFLLITLVSLGLALAITIIYRVLTNPDDVRKIKSDMKFYREKSTEAQKAGDREKSSRYASEMMKLSQKQMKFTMKPMFATMILFLFLLGWLNTTFGGVTADFSGEENPVFAYAGQEHELMYEPGEKGFTAGVDLDNDGVFSDDEKFSQGDVFRHEGVFWRPAPVTEGFFLFATEKENAVHFEMLVAKSPVTIPFIGDYLSWLWWYIIISVPASIVFRKLLGVE